mgnify:CR=1 FL=1
MDILIILRLKNALEDKTIKLATIQRSKGYQTRPSYSVEKIRRTDRIYQRASPGCHLYGR